mmetsp:Transcript_910/g.1613  ORF Transcript_910/g.1613 Transcript_910/m.1613 type:complete len:524 (-) Transcript_910:325-1896(-)|eukprot:CAMPEP_0198214108 /NCGR_PEP_ID=MMETSP1445-20131203/37694_1 /TAXON_ID=36898 /ORGANISM="Pyramimonas sp., Strain CCMP2087" /LENGTH=523 /DNA_ID=CAMNT_0043889113 /DNA_START=49 /DNA_END=1620 /DNA_ORIENTATION=-
MGTTTQDANHVHNFWGFSAPLDLKYLSVASRILQVAMDDELETGLDLDADQDQKLAILQVSPCDPRHTLQTLARSWRRQPERTVQITVFETSCEALARHMILISIFMDTELTARDRMETYLEVFGNVKVREKTAEYLEERGKLLANVVLDSNFGEGDGVFNRLFDFSQLKFKEKDEMVDILRSYTRKQDYNMDAAWDWRCRKFYGERYDHLKNLVDWDYHMRLRETGASIIHFREFRDFRKTGIAFDIRDSSFIEPNRTLLGTAVGRTNDFTDRYGKKRGSSVTTRGLYTDMQSSPYMAFGVECEEKRFFRQSNKEHVKTSADVTEFNLEGMIHEMYNHEKYKYIPSQAESDRFPEEENDKNENKPLASVAEEDAESKQNKEDNNQGDDKEKEAKNLDKQKEAATARANATAGQFRISLVTGDLVKNVAKKAANQKAFDVITIGCWMTHRIADGIEKLAKPRAVLAMEDGTYMLSITKEQAVTFRTRVDELAIEAGWQPLSAPLGATPKVHHLFTMKPGPVAA